MLHLIFCLLFISSAFALNDEESCEFWSDYECEQNTTSEFMRWLLEGESCRENVIETVLKILDEGEQKVRYSQTGEAILVVGRTGKGKTTLSYFLAANNSALISYGDDWSHLIKDCNGKIGYSSTVSQTIFPDLLYEEQSNTEYYDNPGFDDSRTSCVEIANGYFMNQVVANLSSTKIILVVDWETVYLGSGNKDFHPSLKSLMGFIPAIDKFTNNSVGLMVTKVKQLVNDDNEIDYEKAIGSVEKFLEQALLQANETYEGPDLQKAAKLITSFQRTGSLGNDLQHVGFFIEPPECGRLDTIEAMVKNRQDLHMMVDKLDWVPVTKDDFSVNIAAEAILTVQEVLETMHGEVKNILLNILLTTNEEILKLSNCETDKSCQDFIDSIFLLHTNQHYMDDVENWQSFTLTELLELLLDEQYFHTSLYYPVDMKLAAVQLSTRIVKLQQVVDFPTDHSDIIEEISSFKSDINDLVNKVKLNEFTRLQEKVIFITETIGDSLKELSGCITTTDGCSTFLVSVSNLSANPDFAKNYENGEEFELLNIEEFVLRLLNPIYFHEALQIAYEDIELCLVRAERLVQLENVTLEETVGHLSWLNYFKTMKSDTIQHLDNSQPTIELSIHDKLTSFAVSMTNISLNTIYSQTSLLDRKPIIDELKSITASKYEFILDHIENEKDFISYLQACGTVYTDMTNDTKYNAEIEIFISYLSAIKMFDITLELDRTNEQYWLEHISDYHATIFREYTWFTFLENLFSDLSSTGLQVDLGKELEEIYNKNGNFTDKVDIETNLFQLYHDVPAVYMADKAVLLAAFGHNDYDKTKIKDLNEVLETTLRASKCQNSGPTATIEGNFITASEIIDCVQSNTTETIVVYSFSKLFLDVSLYGADINMLKNVQVLILSPYVEANQEINLIGYNYGNQADIPGIGGQDGAAGKPGGLGGSIVIYIGNTSDVIVVNNSGGKGENGQRGQKGETGSNGKTADQVKEHLTVDCRKDDVEIFMDKGHGAWCDPFSYCDDKGNMHCDASNGGTYVELYGEPGENGFTGGDGGKGGLGGYGGLSLIYYSELGTTNCKRGQIGAEGGIGAGGEGGNGGLYGETCFSQVNDIKDWPNPYYCVYSDQGCKGSEKNSTTGNSGTPGGSGEVPEAPLPFVFKPSDFTNYVGIYKQKAMAHLEEHFVLKSNYAFAVQMDYNKIVNSCQIYY